MDVKVTKTVERSKPSDDGSYLSLRKNSYNKPVYTVPANDDDLLNKRGALISKALRTLGLRVIPGDLQDEAEAIIKEVRTNEAARDPDAERKKVVDAFAELNISASQLRDYLDHDLGQCTPPELVNLRGLYGALRDGEATWASAMENKREQDDAKSKDAQKPIRPAYLEALRGKQPAQQGAAQTTDDQDDAALRAGMDRPSADVDNTRSTSAKRTRTAPAPAPEQVDSDTGEVTESTYTPTVADALALVESGQIEDAQDMARSLGEEDAAQVFNAIQAKSKAKK
jgi:hypothetical protein